MDDLKLYVPEDKEVETMQQIIPGFAEVIDGEHGTKCAKTTQKKRN